MTQIVEAVFDGEVLRPAGELCLAPNTRVRLTVESLPTQETKRPSFLQTARALSLEGPPDWSENLDDYLHGDADPSKG